jgi:hypothetical protein
MSYVGSILVEDASGCRFHLYEYQERRFLLKNRRYVLDSGERTEVVDRHTFRIVRTGETLVRVSA